MEWLTVLDISGYRHLINIAHIVAIYERYLDSKRIWQIELETRNVTISYETFKELICHPFWNKITIGDNKL